MTGPSARSPSPHRKTLLSRLFGDSSLATSSAKRSRVAVLFKRLNGLIQAPSHLLARERGQALTRCGVSSVVTIYLVLSHHPVHVLEMWFLFCVSYLAFSVVVVGLALKDREHSILRRTLSNVADACAISYLMIATGEMGLPLFILYLFITLGNGFRFGISALLVSSVLCVVGFSAVIGFSDIWQAQSNMAAGVLAGLIVIPAYAASLIRKLHEARLRAEEASAAKSHFLARMSHELRTPLNGILGTTELLGASKRLTREDRSLLEVIKDSVKVSMRQIDNVLDFSKIEAGKLVIERIPFDLHELLNRAVRLVRALAVEKSLRLTLRIDPTIPYELVGDPHHVHEVLLNLLSNALKFTERGYVSLEAHLLEQTENSVVVRFEVHDTGIGIEPQALARIFEAFSQEDTATTRRYGGTGLGTTIAKQLVELMDGELQVQSTKGKGSTFHADIRFGRPASQPQSQPTLAGMRVLCLTKDATLRAYLSSLAEKWSAGVTVVSTVAEAVGLLGRGIRLGNRVHVVLADSRCVFTSGGAHCAEDFLDKAAGSAAPVFLLCDVSPEKAQLREWGYAAAISYDVPASVLFHALHTGSAYDAEYERSVVQIEPWAWGKSKQPRARLLVADDNRTNLMILRRVLENASYEVDTADDGERALDMMLRNRYKAAVLDMHMPGLDGIAVIKQYRLMRRGARMPIVMLTANATVDAKLESAEAGADAYLTKPATAAEVVSTIKKLLDDTEVFDISSLRAEKTEAVTTGEVAVLDTEVIVELDRLYGDPKEMNRLLDTFESEGRRLLNDLETAFTEKNHAAFSDHIHALKGNGANVGALRLAQTCREMEGCGLLEFRREGKEMLSRLASAFADAAKALREFTTAGDMGPARGSDLH